MSWPENHIITVKKTCDQFRKIAINNFVFLVVGGKFQPAHSGPW
jgi:hypothetical protein